MKQLFMKPDAYLFPSFATLQSDTIYNIVLSANVEKVVTIPAGASYVIFSSDKNIWVRFNGTAVVPTVDITNGSGSELNPSSRYLYGATTIHLVSSDDCLCSLAFYKE